MSSVVAAAALREFGVDALCVWQVVAITTCRYSSVLVGVAGYTSNVVVLGCGRHQLIKGSVMAGSTVNVRSAVRVFKNQRLVNIVTDGAVVLGLGFRV